VGVAPVSGVLTCPLLLRRPRSLHPPPHSLAPFWALPPARPVPRLLRAPRPADGVAVSWPRTSGPRAARRLGMAIAGVTAVAPAGGGGFPFRFESMVPPGLGPIPAALDRVVPPPACAPADQVSVTLPAHRVQATDPHCRQMVDTLGTTRALSYGLKPATGAWRVPAVNAAWNEAFRNAQYVLLTATSTRRIAWTFALQGYLSSHFTQV